MNYTSADAAFDAEQLGTGPFAGRDPFLAKCRERGRQWAINNPDWADLLTNTRVSFEACEWAENQAEQDALNTFNIQCLDDIDEFLEGAREQSIKQC